MRSVASIGERGLTEGVDVEGGDNHEEGNDYEGYLEPLLQFATEDNSVETAFLET